MHKISKHVSPEAQILIISSLNNAGKCQLDCRRDSLYAGSRAHSNQS